MKKMILSLLTIFITSITYCQEVNNFYDILTVDTKVEATNLSIEYKNGITNIVKDFQKSNRKKKKRKPNKFKFIYEGRDTIDMKMNKGLMESDFKFNFENDTLIVMSFYNNVNPFFSHSAYFISNNDKIIAYSAKEASRNDYDDQYDDLFTFVRKELDDELLLYVKTYGHDTSDCSSMKIQRYVIKDKLIKSCKVWNIPYCYDFDRWERDILKNKN